MKHSSWVVFFFAVALPTTALSWSGKEGNKSADELLLLQPYQLIIEVQSVCTQAVTWRKSNTPNVSDATTYLQTVINVARKAYPKTLNEWLDRFSAVALGDDQAQCAAIGSEYLATNQSRNP